MTTLDAASEAVGVATPLVFAGLAWWLVGKFYSLLGQKKAWAATTVIAVGYVLMYALGWAVLYWLGDAHNDGGSGGASIGWIIVVGGACLAVACLFTLGWIVALNIVVFRKRDEPS